MLDALRARHVPPALPGGVTLTVTLVFVGLTLTRGLAYLTVDPGIVAELRTVGSFDLAFFGTLLVIGAAAFFAAVVARLHFAVWVAHVFLICTYFGLAVTMFGECLDYGGAWNLLVAPVGGIIWHSVLSRSMRPFPPHEALRDARQ